MRARDCHCVDWAREDGGVEWDANCTTCKGTGYRTYEAESALMEMDPDQIPQDDFRVVSIVGADGSHRPCEPLVVTAEAREHALDHIRSAVRESIAMHGVVSARHAMMRVVMDRGWWDQQ